MIFYVEKPATVYVNMLVVPETFTVTRNGKLYFFRELHQKPQYKNIKFNICHPGEYEMNGAQITDIKPIEIEPLNIPLPPYERNREKGYTVIVNPYMTGTPARHYTEIGLIEVSPEFLRMMDAIKYFILLHEYAHFFYNTEEYCDLWAADKFIREGYNPSTAFYSLSKILKRSRANEKRLNFLHKYLVK